MDKVAIECMEDPLLFFHITYTAVTVLFPKSESHAPPPTPPQRVWTIKQPTELTAKLQCFKIREHNIQQQWGTKKVPCVPCSLVCLVGDSSISTSSTTAEYCNDLTLEPIAKKLVYGVVVLVHRLLSPARQLFGAI